MIQGSRRVPLSGWGRYPVAACALARASRVEDAAAIAAGSASLVARGAGRSYGDSSLNPALTLATAGMNRMLAFEEAEGRLTCEAGLLLADLIDVFLPRGWFPPVTPGTKYVTVAGMIAADVHGKNHHKAGSFCDHVEWIDLLLGDGAVTRCSPAQNRDLFAATCGGMGLTGIIVRACFRLIPVETAQIRQQRLRAANLDEAMTLLEDALDWTYSVAWIDCLARGAELGRSVLFLAEHARIEDLHPARRGNPLGRPERRRKSVPIDFPSFAMGALTVRLFNALYYRAHRPANSLEDIDPYFYPLDAIGDWNRIYGRRGFVQYQCVLPLERSREGMARLVEAISAAGLGSFLAVLKRMGPQSFGLLSFPMPGYTLALDFPVSAATMDLLLALDEITLAHGGRLYLAKDARAGAATFASGYPRLGAFREVRRRWALDTKFTSLQSERLNI